MVNGKKVEDRFQKTRMRKAGFMYALFKFQRPLYTAEADPQVLVYNEESTTRFSLSLKSHPDFVTMFKGQPKFYAYCWFDPTTLSMEFDVTTKILHEPEEWPKW